MEKENTIKINAASTKRKDSELQAKSRALEEKDATISAMSEQLTKTREYLATEKQVSIKEGYAGLGRLVSLIKYSYIIIIHARKMISSARASLLSWHQLYSRVFICIAKS